MAEEKSYVAITIIILVLLFLASSFLIVQNDYFPTRSAFDDAYSFFQIFQGVVTDDAGEVSQHINQGMTFFGLFILLFLIIFFTFKMSLPHILSKRAGIMLAFIITIYAFTNNKIYGYMINGISYLISVLVFLALILILWGGFSALSEKEPKKE